MIRHTRMIYLYMLLCLVACNKKADPPLIRLDSEVKARFNIKAGSYWIYRDSLSNLSDSFMVTDNRSGTADISSGNVNGQYEYILTFINQQYPGTKAGDSARWLFEISPSLNEPGLSYISLSVGYGDNSSGYFLDPARGQYPFKQTDTNGYIANTYPTYTLKGTVYNNVICYVKRDPINPVNYSICFFNDSVGVIKMEINQEKLGSNPRFHKIWELERYHMIK